MDLSIAPMVCRELIFKRQSIFDNNEFINTYTMCLYSVISTSCQVQVEKIFNRETNQEGYQ